MPTDLTTIYDHPVQVLLRTPDQPVGTYTAAVTRLAGYEADHGVTFAALDNDALTAVREAYEAGRGNPLKSERERLIDLLGAVNALLGLGDS